MKCVAPHVGAWIETRYTQVWATSDHVAPHVGAWIETMWQVCRMLVTKSRPTWARGLKHTINIRENPLRSRAPRGRVD